MSFFPFFLVNKALLYLLEKQRVFSPLPCKARGKASFRLALLVPFANKNEVFITKQGTKANLLKIKLI